MAKTKTLLIITQKVDINDDVLGFFHRWLEKFSEKLEKLYVICLSEGEHHLPKNVVVYSLGKEKGFSKIRKFFRLQKFLLRYIREVDGVFIHMGTIYAIASFPLAKIFKKRLILWYVHRSLNLGLKIAEKCVDKILTASKEGCRLKNRKKIDILRHGIDTEFFKPDYNKNDTNKKFKILSVGRIAPIKDQATLIEAIDLLINQKNIIDFEVKFIGSSLEDYEKKYLEQVKNLVEEKKLADFVEFLGGMPQQEIAGFYQESDVFVNLCPTGGLDKAVLEAMACGIPVLVCNEAFRKDLGSYADELIFQEKNPDDLARKILNLRNLNITEMARYLRNQVVQNHNLDNLIDKIINVFK
ncbi:MAG: glycosyltransferase family 4 protein [Candidatus Nealsonbacteria bacterium]|nr:glycosyltransferase family 4 protein [Candidatus Nealsonbacteria bacterium]